MLRNIIIIFLVMMLLFPLAYAELVRPPKCPQEITYSDGSTKQIILCDDDFPLYPVIHDNQVRSINNLVQSFVEKAVNETLDVRITLSSNDISKSDPPNAFFRLCSFECVEILSYNYILSLFSKDYNDELTSRWPSKAGEDTPFSSLISFSDYPYDGVVVISITYPLPSDSRVLALRTHSGAIEHTSSGDTSVNSSVNNLPPAEGTKCGVFKTHVRLCYKGANNIYFYDPIPRSKPVSTYVKSTLDKEGYVIVAYAPDNNKTGVVESRVSNVRDIIKNEAIAKGIDIPVASTIIHGNAPTVKGKPTNHSVFVVSKNNIDNLTDNLSVIKSAANQLLNGKSIEDIEHEEWLGTAKKTIKDAEKLVKKVYERTGIMPVILISETVLPISSKVDVSKASHTKLTSEELAKMLKESNNDNTNFEDFKACYAYIIIDPEVTHLYQKPSCWLKISSDVLKNPSREDQVIRILKSALDNTPPVDPEKVILSGFSLLSEPDISTIRPKLVKDAESFADWVLENKDWIENKYGSYKHYKASANALIAKVKYVKGDYDESIKIINDNIIDTLTSVRSLAAHTAVQAAAAKGDCVLISTIMNKYSKFVANGASAMARAYRLLDDCQLAKVRDRCEDYTDHKNNTDALDTTILFINDDMPVRDFNIWASLIRKNILTTPNIDDFSDKISFRKLDELTSPIVTSGAELKPPSVNNRLAKITTDGCSGDIALVLSNKIFLPSVYPGSGQSSAPIGYISVSACNELRSCVKIYSLRSLAFGLFRLPPEEGTATAPLTFNKETQTIKGFFSAEQQRMIADYFTNGGII